MARKKVGIQKLAPHESNEVKPFYYFFGPTKIHILAKTQQEADHLLSGMKLLKNKFKKKKEL
jgi:hypothetical protein